MESIQARCRCGAVSFQIKIEPDFAARMLLPEICGCGVHLGRGGPPMIASAVIPLRCLLFDRGYEVCGALVNKSTRRLIPENAAENGAHPLCNCCGDTLIVEHAGAVHVFSARFGQYDGSEGQIQLELWISRKGERTIHGGPPITNQADAEAHFDRMQEPPPVPENAST